MDTRSDSQSSDELVLPKDSNAADLPPLILGRNYVLLDHIGDLYCQMNDYTISSLYY